MASSRDRAAQVFYVDLISLECTTSDDIEETQLIDLKDADNRTAEVTIIDDDEPGVIACELGVPSCGVTPSTRGHRTRSWVVSLSSLRPYRDRDAPRRFQAPSQGSPTRLPPVTASEKAGHAKIRIGRYNGANGEVSVDCTFVDGAISASRCVETPSRHRRDSWVVSGPNLSRFGPRSTGDAPRRFGGQRHALQSGQPPHHVPQ